MRRDGRAYQRKGYAMIWADWLRIWNAQKRQAITAGCDLKELLKADLEALGRMPKLQPWPEGQRACDNRGEVDGAGVDLV